MPMPSKARDNFSDRILAVVQPGESSARILMVLLDGSDLTLVAATSSPMPVQRTLDELWQKHGRGRELRIVPGPRSVCRSGTVASGNDADTVAAAALVAEALLPADLPAHRRAAGVIAGAPGSTDSRVVATAWIGEAEASLAPAPAKASRRAGTREPRWITQVGALAGAAAGDGLVAWIDPDARTIALLANGPERAVARQLLGESDSSRAWTTSVEVAAAETTVAAGFDHASPSPAAGIGSARGLFASPSLRAKLRGAVRGAPTDDGWLAEYGLCVAAAIVAAGPATLRPLAQLAPHAPLVREPLALRAATALTTGNRSRVVIAAGLALLVLGPVGFAFARHSVLKSKVSRLDEQQTSREESQRVAALYEQLEVSRWPVTKLLSDVSIATPVGVSADAVTISNELGLKFSGRADSQALVNMLQANLNSTKLFRNVEVGRTETLEGGKVAFDLTARIASPHNKVTGMEDFAKTNLAERLHGPGADNLKEAPLADSAARRTSRAERGDDTGKDASGSSRRAADAGPPAAVTDADIAKMDRNTAMREWANRKSYIQKNPTLDTETKDRLNSEATKLSEQMKKAQAAPASGAPK
ncbi:MAG: hypothetical protein AMXMBFR58_16580 [Phycisphaerae bacterium]